MQESGIRLRVLCAVGPRAITPASPIRRHTCSDVSGMWRSVTPTSASRAALTTAAGAPIEPASPVIVELWVVVPLRQLQRRDDRHADRDRADAPAQCLVPGAYGLATALFGGFTPAISTFLIEVTGNRAAAGLWLMITAPRGLAAALLAWRPGFSERRCR